MTFLADLLSLRRFPGNLGRHLVNDQASLSTPIRRGALSARSMIALLAGHLHNIEWQNT
jgi:hypothetical protein